MQIGVSRADITPPARSGLIGFAGRDLTTGVHDPLTATALVAADAGRTVAIVSCDLLGVHAAFTAGVREEVRKLVGLPPDHVMIACTHTHYGPDLYHEPGTPRDAAYQENLKYLLADLVADAASRRREAVIGTGGGSSDIGINRRERRPDGTVWLGSNPSGVVDRTLGVCRIDAVDGGPIATLLNFQTHPVVQSGRTAHISADYPGVTRCVVEESTRATCLFLQGAAGNINPIVMEPSFEPVESLGRRLACEAIRVWETIAPVPEGGVAAASRVVDLPRYRYDSKENAERVAGELVRQIDTIEKSEAPRPGELWWARHRLERVREAVESWSTGTRKTIPAEFQALAIGGLGVVSAPGEVFNELGTRVRDASPFSRTFFLGCTNDSIGYIPVSEAYAEGGYEVTHACRVDPEASDLLVTTCRALLSECLLAR